MTTDGESVKLGFGTLPEGVSAGPTAETVVSITDDDVPAVEVSFEQASYTVAEGSSVTVKVKLDAEPERTVTVPLTKANQGGATSADYSGVPSNVTFNSGDTEKSISFSAASDSDNDDGESVKLGFGNLPAGVSAGSTNETVVSITDDDVPPVTVSFEQGSYTVAEGSSINITVTLDQDPERTVTIPLTVTNQGGATSTDHSLVPENITFNAGQTSRTFSFQADQDTDNDDGESVKLGFGSLPEGVSAGPTAETTVSITDDDAAPTEQSNSFLVSFGASEYSVSEGGPNAAVTVQLNRAAEGEITVPITAAGMNGATRDDWTGVPPMLSFSIGQRSKTFTVMAYDDDIEDDGEAVELGFGSLPDGVTSTSPQHRHGPPHEHRNTGHGDV